MSDTNDYDEKAILKTAEGFPLKKRALFLALLPARVRACVVEQLHLSDAGNLSPEIDDESGETVELPTLIMEAREDFRNQTDSAVFDSTGEAQTELIEPVDGVSQSLAETNRSSDNDVHDSGTQVEEPQSSLDATLVGKSINRHPSNEQGDTTGEDIQARVHLLRRHARGAIGEVFVAYDYQLSREVALKRIRPELSRDERHVMRFIREAVITAQLQHPGIVPIYNFGKHSESSHYTMPLISGSTLAEAISKAYLGLGVQPTTEEWMSRIRPLLNHFVAVCQAIDYAHSRNVLHRDLKPSNIMIGSQGQTLVLDWGCAKVLDEKDGAVGAANFKIASRPQARDRNSDAAFDSDVTIAGTVMGTVEFMSPEQAEGEMENIGPSSDIFGLGATLFNLLTNETAIGISNDVETSLKKVREGDFANVNQIAPWVPPPLAAICHRAMKIEPDERYKTSGEMARDIDAFLAGEPVAAYTETLPERGVRYLKQHNVLVATMIGLLIVGMGALIPVTIMVEKQRGIVEVTNLRLNDLTGDLDRSQEINDRLTSAIQQRDQTIRRRSYASDMLRATEAATQNGQLHIVRDLIDKWNGSADETGWEWQQLKLSLSSEAGKNSFDQILREHPSFAWHPNGDQIAVAHGNHVLIQRIDGQSNTIAPDHSDQFDIVAIDYSRKGDRLACLSDDGLVFTIDATTGVIDREYGVKSVSSFDYEPRGKTVAWSRDDRYLAAVGPEGRIHVWDIESGEDLSSCFETHPLLEATGDSQEDRSEKEQGNQTDTGAKTRFNYLAFDPNSMRLAYAGDGDRFYIFDLDRMEYVARFKKMPGKSSLAWSPEGDQIALSVGSSITIWDVTGQRRVQNLVGPSGLITDITWGKTCNRIAAITDNDRICIWETRSWIWCANYAVQKESAYAIGWSPDSTLLGSTSSFGKFEMLRSE